MTDTIDGEVIVEEHEPIRALVVAQPGQALINRPEDGPADMIGVATKLASALKDVVERQHLYSVISGKKFPQVEAWMTIGRLDNVVAREAERPIRNDDGSYEAFVELVRLSDGMVIGRASALCGTPDDKPWAGRSEPNRRSMAVTRATSRAFRQQYSWIMALAGYEPTPADEMPVPEPHQPSEFAQRHPGVVETREQPALERTNGGLIGVASLGTSAPVDGHVRQTPDGMSIGFVIGEGRNKVQVVAVGPKAEAFAPLLPGILGQRVQTYGDASDETMTVRGKAIPFVRVRLTKLVTPDATFDFGVDPAEAPSIPLFDDDEQKAIDAALEAVAG